MKHTQAFKEHRHRDRVIRHAVKRAKTRTPYTQPTGQLARRNNVIYGKFFDWLKNDKQTFRRAG